jgi:Tfp pilus assembly protein PilV
VSSVGPFSQANGQKGFGLIGAMVAAALLAIVALTLLTMVGTIQDVTAHTNQDKAAADLTRYIQNLLIEPAICNNALRSAPFVGAPFGVPLPADVSWAPGTTVSIDHIEIYKSAAISMLAARKTELVNKGLELTDIQLRSPDPTLGEAVSFVTTPVNPVKVVRGGVTYYAYPAKLVLRFTQVPAGLGGPIADKTVDINVATTSPPGGAPAIVKMCYQPNQVKNIQFLCNASHLYPGNPDCSTLTGGLYHYWYWGGSAVACAPIYYIQGTDALGAPMCACRLNCITPAAYGGGYVP